MSDRVVSRSRAGFRPHVPHVAAVVGGQREGRRRLRRWPGIRRWRAPPVQHGVDKPKATEQLARNPGSQRDIAPQPGSRQRPPQGAQRTRVTGTPAQAG